MTEFIIKGISAVLPKDISFSLIDENAEITNNGSFTWDIELSLMNPVNAKIFKHINRLNINSIETRMDAALIVDNKVRRGSIVVLSTTDKSVSTQFLSGNSELNYIAKNERKIWELGGLNGWGVESAISLSRAIESIGYSGYGPFNFVCAPVIVGDEIVNDYVVGHQDTGYALLTSFYNISTQIPLSTGYYTLTTAIAAIPVGMKKNAFVVEFYSDATTLVRYQYVYFDLSQWVTETNWIQYGVKIVMQPYLLFYVNKLPELLGYTLKSNVLNSVERAKVMYFTNSVGTLNYADALPDWTISQFIEEIENFFNVQFIVNANEKSISIERLDSNMVNKRIVTIDKVLDSYVRSLTEDSKSIKLDFTRISYDVVDSVYFKYQKLSDDILAKCEIKEFATYSTLRTFIQNAVSIDNKLIIYRDLEKSNDYFVRKYADGLTINTSLFTDTVTHVVNNRLEGWVICFINKFSSVGTDSTRELALKLCPAEIVEKSKIITEYYLGGGSGTEKRFYQLPKSNNSFFVNNEKGFIDTVEKGETDIPRSDKLEVALYTGKIAMPGHLNSLSNYPFSHIDVYPEFTPGYEEWFADNFQVKAITSLRLSGNDGIAADFNQHAIIDTSKEYTFDFIEKKSVSANDLFSIKNKTYMPISLERTVGINGFGKVVKTKCYALK